MDPTTRGLIIEYSTRIEDLLRDNFGAEGDGINEMLDGLGDKIPYDLQQSLRYIASVRNKAAHRYVLEIVDTDSFLNSCKSSISSLEVLSTHEFTRFSSPSRESAPSQQNFTVPSQQSATSDVRETPSASWTASDWFAFISKFSLLIGIGFVIFLVIGGVQYTQQVFTDLTHAISTAVQQLGSSTLPTRQQQMKAKCDEVAAEYKQWFEVGARIRFNQARYQPQQVAQVTHREFRASQVKWEEEKTYCQKKTPGWAPPFGDYVVITSSLAH